MANHILFFLLNGAGTLILETAWLKKQIALFGASPESYGSILFTYFLGISCGSWYFRRRRIDGTVMKKVYAGFGLAMLFSLVLPVVLLDHLSFSAAFVYGSPTLYKAFIWALAVISIFPSCFFLGGFFPIVSRTVNQRNFLFLYGMQTLGTLLGIYFGAFFLPYTIGYFATFLTGIGINVVSLYFLGKLLNDHLPGMNVGDDGRDRSPRYETLAFLSGFFSLVLQILWIRWIALGTDNSIYAFGSASIIVLVQLTLSFSLVSRAPGAWFRSGNTLIVLLFLSLAGILASSVIFLRMTDNLAINLIRNATGLFGSLAFASSFIFVGYLFPSFIFPSIIRTVSLEGGAEEGRSVDIGRLIASNSIGCALGSLLGSFVFLPKFGLWPTLVISLAGYALFMLFTGNVRVRIAALAAGVVLIAAVNPTQNPLVTPTNAQDRDSRGSVVWVKEGKYGIVSVIDYPNRRRTLWLNNTYQLEAGMDDIRGPYRMGLLPTVLNPSAKRLAMIGVGTGILSSAFLNSRLEEINLVELIPEVVEAATVYFPAFNEQVLERARVRTIVGDGRLFLKTGTGKFDIICSDLFTPWNEGTAYLYTVEHFRNVKERLNADGLFCLWLPLFQITREEFLIIAKSFATVFPHTTLWQVSWGTDVSAVALVGAEKIRTEAIREYIADRPFPERAPDFIQIHESGVFGMYIGPVVLEDAFWKDIPLNTLDRPLIEFKAAQKGRILLKGKELLNLFETFFKLPGNPGGWFFTHYDDQLNSYRTTGWYLNQYAYHLLNGDTKQASDVSWALSLPALSQYEAMRKK